MKKIVACLFLFSLLLNCSETKEQAEKSSGPAQQEEIKQESADEYNARMRAAVLKKSNEKLNNKKTKVNEWYEGGNLHQSKIFDWKSATNENKLATCADFMAKVQKVSNMNDLLAKSIELRSCINEATRGLASTDHEKISDIAVLCIIQLEY